jgi:hypothetical protein
VSDYVDPAFLAPLNLDQLAKLLKKVDLTLEEGRELREKIVRAMYERRQSSGSHAIGNGGKPESLSS